jgi:hypothetical protein
LEASLHERAQQAERSAVAVLGGFLTGRKRSTAKIRSHLAPKIGHLKDDSPGRHSGRGF